MPYISNEQVKEKRQAIKKEFPSKEGWKFSITRNNHSSIELSILEAPFNMITDDRYEGNQSVNHLWAKEHFIDHPKIADVLVKITDILEEGNKTITVDGDYGNVPKFYTSIEIGKWDKPFKISEVA